MGSYPSSRLIEILCEYMARAGSIVYVICPFITPSVLRELGGPTVERMIVVTSWRGDHLRTGVSSLELYEVCGENGWTLFVNDRLHAKVYSDSLQSAWVGSANLTESALEGREDGNLEWLTYKDALTAPERVWIMRMVGESRLVTEDLYTRYREWLSTQDRLERVPRETTVVDSEHFTPDPFLTSQLPASESPRAVWDAATNGFPGESDENLTALHDVALYRLDPADTSSREQFFAQLGERFFEHPFIRALEAAIPPEGIYFGRMKEWVHKNCTDVPVPFRRELTPRIQSLYQWFTVLAPTQYEIVRPRHSECLRRIGRT